MQPLLDFKEHTMHDKAYAASGSEVLLATDAALEALAWSEVGEDGEPLNSLGLDFDEESRELVRSELRSFIEACSDDLDGIDYRQIGHDFILTRNGHGAGFWDRGLGAVGDRLTAMCKPYGEIRAFVLNGHLRAE